MKIERYLPYFLGVLLVIGLADTLVLGLWYWLPGRSFDGSTSGVWLGLAWDFADGVFYRPIISDISYGGTRYVPIFFMLHGSLIALGLPPVGAGVALMQATVALMVLAIAWALIQQGVGRLWALSIAAITFCTTIYQSYLTDVNADYLAAGLSLVALAIYVQAPKGAVSILRLCVVALLCVAAILTKFSTVYVPVALWFSLLFSRDWGRLAAFTVIGLLSLGACVVALNFWSDGRMLNSLAATSGAGTDWDYAAGFLGRFLKEIFFENPAIGVTFLAALWVWFSRMRNTWHAPLPLSFLMVTLVTIVVFASRGIAGNHVIALHAFSLVVAGAAIVGHVKDRAVLLAAVAVLSVIIVATWTPWAPSPLKTLIARDNQTQSQIRATVMRWAPAGGTILSVDASYPILLGQRPFLLDAFNLRNFIAQDGAIARDFEHRIAAQEFAVLIVGTTQDFTPPGAATHPMQDHYEVVDRLGQFTVMVPKR